MRTYTFDEIDVWQTYDGAEFSCPECNRDHYLAAVVLDGRSCRCGVTFGAQLEVIEP